MLARALDGAGLLPDLDPVVRFDDVEPTSVHHHAIVTLAEFGIAQPAAPGVFDPEQTVTRAGFAAMVTRAAEFAAQGEVRARPASFVDLASSDPQADGVTKAAWLRIVLGQPDGLLDAA